MTSAPVLKPVLKVSDLSLSYRIRQGEVKAVQQVSFELERGQSLGLVGESGCWQVLRCQLPDGTASRQRPRGLAGRSCSMEMTCCNCPKMSSACIDGRELPWSSRLP